MKSKTVALYDPYLDVLGGGERHILSILKVLTDEGYEPTIFWERDFTKEISGKLNLAFTKPLVFDKNIFSSSTNNLIQKMKTLSQHDILLYVTDGSYFFSPAKKTFIFSMVPDRKLYSMNFVNSLKTINSRFISNSQFTQRNLSKWGLKSDYLYPYIEDELVNLNILSLRKEKIMLSVGRFFTHLHAKRQDKMIETFIRMKKDIPEMKFYKLILAGGLKEEDKDYFGELQQLKGDDKSIILKPNVSHTELLELYKKSEIYWHFAGYDIDEEEHPEYTEHLGITPLEAQSAGCITFCYSAGGLKEIINDGENGYLFQSYDELKLKMEKYFRSEEDTLMMKNNAKAYIKKTFSYRVFAENVKKIIDK